MKIGLVDTWNAGRYNGEKKKKRGSSYAIKECKRLT